MKTSNNFENLKIDQIISIFYPETGCTAKGTVANVSQNKLVLNNTTLSKDGVEFDYEEEHFVKDYEMFTIN